MQVLWDFLDIDSVQRLEHQIAEMKARGGKRASAYPLTWARGLGVEALGILHGKRRTVEGDRPKVTRERVRARRKDMAKVT